MIDSCFAIISQTLLTIALPPSVKYGWLLLCYHQSDTVDYCFAIISQTRLTLACHHQSDTVDYCFATISQIRLTLALPPSVKYGWLLLCHHQSNAFDHCFVTISQTGLTITLSPMSRSPYPFVPNALDIRQQSPVAVYMVKFYCMKCFWWPHVSVEWFPVDLASSVSSSALPSNAFYSCASSLLFKLM